MKKLLELQLVQWLNMGMCNGGVVGCTPNSDELFLTFLILFTQNALSYRSCKVRADYYFFFLNLPKIS